MNYLKTEFSTVRQKGLLYKHGRKAIWVGLDYLETEFSTDRLVVRGCKVCRAVQPLLEVRVGTPQNAISPGRLSPLLLLPGGLRGSEIVSAQETV